MTRLTCRITLALTPFVQRQAAIAPACGLAVAGVGHQAQPVDTRPAAPRLMTGWAAPVRLAGNVPTTMTPQILRTFATRSGPIHTALRVPTRTLLSLGYRRLHMSPTASADTEGASVGQVGPESARAGPSSSPQAGSSATGYGGDVGLESMDQSVEKPGGGGINPRPPADGGKADPDPRVVGRDDSSASSVGEAAGGGDSGKGRTEPAPEVEPGVPKGKSPLSGGSDTGLGARGYSTRAERPQEGSKERTRSGPQGTGPETAASDGAPPSAAMGTPGASQSFGGGDWNKNEQILMDAQMAGNAMLRNKPRSTSSNEGQDSKQHITCPGIVEPHDNASTGTQQAQSDSPITPEGNIKGRTLPHQPTSEPPVNDRDPPSASFPA